MMNLPPRRKLERISQLHCLGKYVVLAGLAIALTIGEPASADDSANDASQITSGVSEIARPGLPGTVAVFGPGASAVVAAPIAGGGLGAVVAAAPLGKGWVVVFGHDGFVTAHAIADTGVLMTNAVRWASRSGRPRVGVVGNDALATWLGEQGFAVTFLSPEIWSAALHQFDVVVATARHFADQQQSELLLKFVQRGGGLITAEIGWGWQQLHPGKTLVEHPGQRVIGKAGLAWTGQTLAGGSKTIAVAPIPAEVHAAAALKLLQQDFLEPNESLEASRVARARAALIGAASVLAREDKLLRPRLQRLRREFRDQLAPTPERPLGTEQALLQALLLLEMLELEANPLEIRHAHPSATAFPGAVPDNARRVTRQIEIDTEQHGWQSTGLYAAPGERVTVTVPQEIVDDDYFVRIGCHTDDISVHPSWSRVPRISRRFPINATKMIVANPFGGPIYIELPERAPSSRFEVTLRRAVEAPLYIHGTTDVEEWLRSIRHYPAPWAELVSDKVSLSVPSAAIRDLENPDELMEVWTRIADASADLAVRPRNRRRAERYVADVQISAGYMHAGYPIMTHLDAAKPMTSTEQLLSGRWGLFHELGHNHQSPHWTFLGTGEVTVNLFTLYVYETVCGKSAAMARDNCTAEWINRQLKVHDSRGATFADWSRDPFLALGMYVQLREAFGWDAFKGAFKGYRDASRDELPSNEQQKRDQWMVRFSRQVGFNLGPFFQAWGVPVSEEGRASIASLPEWFPEDWPLEQ